MAIDNFVSIEKGIPREGKYRKYPWGEMQIGDSVIVRFNYSAPYIKALEKRYKPFKFEFHKYSGIGRVWRIE